ncbi:class I SAM-dependent rRNA methyltransferase [soil metagenome]
MAGLVVSPRARIYHGHDWVYSSEIKKTFGDPAPGEVVTLKDFKDRPLGSAIYNPASQIVARRISRRTQDLDADFFERRLARAHAFRHDTLGLPDDAPQRLVWSESDGLPGVVIDRYGTHFVLQTLTLGMDLRKGLIADALASRFGAASVIERNDSPIRKAEGLELVTGVLRGTDPGAIEVTTPAGIRLGSIPLEGQKTGLYLDQFASYAEVAAHAPGRRVLDMFSNQGGFALHCAAAGAATVTAVESSAPAVAGIRENAERNGLADKIEAVEHNAFDFLKHAAADSDSPQYDLIVLDPPSFTKSKKRLNDALRGYKEIHLRALQLLAPGGLLATFCCSHHVTDHDFRGVIMSASVDAKRTLRERARFRQRPDHPIIPTIPETEYLKGYLLEVVPSW